MRNEEVFKEPKYRNSKNIAKITSAIHTLGPLSIKQIAMVTEISREDLEKIVVDNSFFKEIKGKRTVYSIPLISSEMSKPSSCNNDASEAVKSVRMAIHEGCNTVTSISTLTGLSVGVIKKVISLMEEVDDIEVNSYKLGGLF